MADLIVRADPHTPLSVIAVWTGDAEVLIHFGDGTPAAAAGRGPVATRRPIRHAYTTPRAYTVTANTAVTDPVTGAVTEGPQAAAVQVYVRPGTAPAVQIAAADDNQQIIEATWNDEPAELISGYVVDHGDGESSTVVGAPGTVVSHGYRPGTYTIGVKDVQADRWLRTTVDVQAPQYDPEFAITGQGRAATATITRLVTPAKAVLIDWGDGDQSTITGAAVGDAVSHDYTADDTYIVQCVYSDGSTDGSAQVVTVPLGRGLKPVPRLDWSPDAADPLAVRLKWLGSGWHYTIKWGDGSEDRVLWYDPPKRHRYEAEGTYQVVCVSDLHAEWTISGEVTVRAFKTPEATAVHVGGGLVRLDITDPGVPVLHRITWGDGTGAVEYGAGMLAPTHQYALGSPQPTITIVDVPARRTTKVAGPPIPPEPVGKRPEWSFHPTYLPPQNHSKPTSIQGSFHGRNLKPGTEYEVRMSWSSSPDNYARATSDAQGRVECVIASETGWTVQSGQFYGPYRHFFAYETSDPAGTFTRIPLVNRQDGLAPVTWYYTFDPVDPWRLYLSVQSPQRGEYTVDWGDGNTETVPCDGLVCAAAHQYDRSVSGATITVTAPDGAQHPMTVKAVTLEVPWICRNNTVYADICASIKYLQGSGYHTPITADWGYGAYGVPHDWNDGMTFMWTPLSQQGEWPLSNAYKSQWRGKPFTVTAYAPLREAVSATLVPPEKTARVHLERTDPWIKTVHGEGFEPGEQVTVRFQSSRLGYWADGDEHQYLREATVTASSDGAFTTRPYRYLGDSMWRSGGVERSAGGGGVLYFDTPWQSREDLLLTYDYLPRDGRIVWPQVDPLSPGGEYRIDWGDQGPVETVTADAMGLPTWHRYTGDGPYRLTVTAPDGREASRLVYRPVLDVKQSTFRANQVDLQQPDVVGDEYFCPVRVDWTSPDANVWGEHLRSPRSTRIMSYSYGPGWQTVTVGMPLSEPQQWSFDIPHVKDAATGPSVRDADQVDVAAWWRLVTPTEGERTGEIRFRNTTGETVRRWAASFTLPSGVRVADAWTAGDAGWADLGGGRWELQAGPGQMIGLEKQGVVGLRIVHPGLDDVKPASITATAWTGQASEIGA